MWLEDKSKDLTKSQSATAGMSLVQYCKKFLESEFIRNVAETFATRIILIFIGLILTVIIARNLGPEGRGLYAVAVTLSSIGVQLGNIGLHASNTYYVSIDRKCLPNIVGNSLLVSFVFAGIAVVALRLFLGLYDIYTPISGLLLTMSLAWVPFGLAYMLLQNILIGIQEIRFYNIIEIFGRILTVSLMCSLLLIGFVNVETIFLSGLISLIICLIWILLKLKTFINAPPYPSLVLLKKNIGYGFKAYLAALFSYLVIRADIILVKYMLDSEQAGYYSIAASMADMIIMLPSVVAVILLPKLTVIESKEEKWSRAKEVTVGVVFAMVPLLGAAGLLANIIIKVLFGEGFIPATSAFLLLLPGLLFLGIQTVVVQYLNSVGFPMLVVIIWAFSCVINIALNVVLIPLYGINGASISSSISYLVVFILIGVYIRRDLNG